MKSIGGSFGTTTTRLRQQVRSLYRSVPVTAMRKALRRAGDISAPARALRWTCAQESPTGGIRVNAAHSFSYAEVTGYLIPTLLTYGELELVVRLVRWLVCIQRGSGAYADPDRGEPCVFDTGQALRGLLAASEIVPEALQAARRASDYLCAEMVSLGAGGFGERYKGNIPESVHLYVLPPLCLAAQVLGRPEYQQAAERCLEYYANRDPVNVNSQLHFIGYKLEALIDLDRVDLAVPVLDRLRSEQGSDGSVRGFSDAPWICSSGLAQLALCWYKTGHWEPADRALAWMEKHQTPEGGFFGSYGPKASYFPKVEVPWAVKFYLDAHRLRVRLFMERNVNFFPSEVSKEDGRVEAILKLIRSGDHVLEVGCGKGRFLKVVRQVYSDSRCTGVDISPRLLEEAPSDIQRLDGSLESIPCPAGNFDVVFSVEAIEHSANPGAAVAEMIRVTRPGGWVVVIDKQRNHWGRLATVPWEWWPEPEYIAELLSRGCDHVTYEPVRYDNHPADGLMIVWRGRKRSGLGGSEWKEVLTSPSLQQDVARRVQFHQISPWAQDVIRSTGTGEQVLEVGSGTGEISLSMAQAGRQVAILDLSLESLHFTQCCASDLQVKIRAICADATRGLPFPEGQFDLVWSSGLIEHFSSPERRRILREMWRVTRERVVVLVPNGASLAYRVGKALQEVEGRWPYGLEIPILSLREDFEAVGLRLVAEYSVGAAHSLSFLPLEHPLREALAVWLDEKSPASMRDCNQGYLLVAHGRKY
jgi:ubiquinone/menaquinone biosynthesis C-methylase UbiE